MIARGHVLSVMKMNIKKSWKKIKDPIDQLANELDLSKKFPNYFNKWIFRIAIALMVIFLFVAWGLDNWRTDTFYIDCPANAYRGYCNNPIFVCSSPDEWMVEGCVLPSLIPKEIKPLCEKGYCDIPIIRAGESIGEKPNSIFEHYNYVCFIIVVVSFALNHYFYVRRYRNQVKKRGRK